MTTALQSPITEASGFNTIHPLNNHSLLLKDARGWTFIPFEQIVRCEADGNYSRITMRNGQVTTTCKTLKMIQKKLPTTQFIRIHQSHLVNWSCVSRISDEKYFILINKEEVPSSRRRWREIVDVMKSQGN